MPFIDLSMLHSSCSRNRRCLALDEHEPAVLIQELFGESWICLKDMKQGCECENWLSCERCSERHPRAACSLNLPFLNLDWSKGSLSFCWLPIKPIILEKVGSLPPLRRAKGEILSVAKDKSPNFIAWALPFCKIRTIKPGCFNTLWGLMD